MRKLLRLLSATTLAGFASLNVAHAQSVAWVQETTTLLSVMESGLVQIGAPVVGIGIIIVGAFAAFSGRLEWNKAAWVLFGGLLIVSGPTALRLLLGL